MITFMPLGLGVSTLSLQSQLQDYPPEDRDPRLSEPISHMTQGSRVTVVPANTNPSASPSMGPSTSQLPLTSATPTSAASTLHGSTSGPQNTDLGNNGLLLPAAVLAIAVVAVVLLLAVQLKKRKAAP